MREPFTITCNKCQSTHVSVVHFHNQFEEGIKLKCNKCKNEEQL